MLRIINAKERNQAFARFMFLFLLTMTMIAMAVYFNWKTPGKIIAILTEQLTTYLEKESKQQSFTALIDSTKNMIDSLGKDQSKDRYVGDLIQRKLKEMAAFSKDNGIDGDMIKTTVSLFYDYVYIKEQFNVSKNSPEQVIKLKEELEQCKHERDEAKQSFELCQKFGN